jgi:hypothetical protein
MPATGSTLSDAGILRTWGWVQVERHDIEIPPSGLVNTTLAAALVGVTPTVIRMWRYRDHLKVAQDPEGNEIRDARGRPLYDYMDVINAEYELRDRARRDPVRYAG